MHEGRRVGAPWAYPYKTAGGRGMGLPAAVCLAAQGRWNNARPGRAIAGAPSGAILSFRGGWVYDHPVSRTSSRAAALTVLGLMLVAGCPENEGVAIAGQWTAVSSEDMSLRIARDGSGTLDYGSFTFAIQVIDSDDPTYTIEVEDNVDSEVGTVIECSFVEPVLECPKPYAFRAKRV